MARKARQSRIWLLLLAAFIIALAGASIPVLASEASTAPESSDLEGDLRVPALSAEDRERLESGDVLITVTEREGTDIKTGHVVGLLDHSMDSIRAVVSDLPRFKEFIPDLLESTVLEPDRGEGTLFRSGLDLPWPVDNRHYTIRIKESLTRIEGRAAYVQSWTYVPGSGNIVDTRGRWLMMPYDLDPSRTLVSYYVYTDPGGYLPDFLVNFATKYYLPDLVEVLKQRIQDFEAGRIPSA